jgi:pullulanase/glycogen debranching enzyme
VVQDVVYNHTFASGPYSSNSVLDKIVPGYYHRRQEDGEICHSTCCNSEAQASTHCRRPVGDSVMDNCMLFRLELLNHAVPC